MRKSKHISFDCSVQTKSLNSNDISCQILIYLCYEKYTIYYISRLFLRVTIHKSPFRYIVLVSQAMGLSAKLGKRLLKNESFMNCHRKFYPKWH